jgi:hypothetical protein
LARKSLLTSYRSRFEKARAVVRPTRHRSMTQFPPSPDGPSVRGHKAGPTKHGRIKDVVLQHCEFYSADRRLPWRKNAQNQAPAPPYIQVRCVEKVACDNHALDGELISC